MADWVKKPDTETSNRPKYDQMVQEEMRERKIMQEQGYQTDSDVPSFF